MTANLAAQRSRALIETLRQARSDIESRYPIRLIGIIGSHARGEARSDSDLDIVYRAAGPLTLFNLGALWSDLHELTGLPVDLVDQAQIRPDFRRDVERELVTF